jgi:DNA-binding transcriptional ArsR family regulator/uncharacterized protein YndB with AHSA1/START domain
MAYQMAFLALADPTRRRVFEQLRCGAQSVGKIASTMPVSRPAVSQHLSVLKKAGLVGARAEGTRRVYYIDPHGLSAIRVWVDQFWDDALTAFQSELKKNGIDQVIEPVRKQLWVKASQARAFAVFTKDMSRWWPPTHSILKSPQKHYIVEPHVGGRWYAVGADDSTCQTGYVIEWNPPARLVLAWQINADWQFDPQLVTEVDVRFIAEGAGSSRIELEHRYLERMGDRAAQLRTRVDFPGGWGAIIESFRKYADGTEGVSID